MDGRFVIVDISLKLVDGAGLKEVFHIGRKIRLTVVSQDLAFQALKVLDLEPQFLEPDWVVDWREWPM